MLMQVDSQTSTGFGRVMKSTVRHMRQQVFHHQHGVDDLASRAKNACRSYLLCVAPLVLIPGKSSALPDGGASSRPLDLPNVTLVAGGDFVMGDHHGYIDPGHPSDELPLHLVHVDSFYIGTFELTNQQYCEYLNAALSEGAVEVRNGLVYAVGDTDTYCFTNQYVSYSSIGWNGTEFSIIDFRANHPVVGVMWYGAAAYCNWLSRQFGLPTCYDLSTWSCGFSRNGFRLPTEAEWEYAGRGGQYSPYYVFPWGNDSTTVSRANWPNSGDPYETGPYPWTTPAGFYSGQLQLRSNYNWPGGQATYQTSDGSNAYGLFDMAGNVWEFVNDWYGQNYYSISPYDNPKGPATGSLMPDGKAYRGMRSGNWYNGQWGHSRVANRNPSYYRGPQDPNHPWYHVGFRVARYAFASTTQIDDSLLSGWNMISNPVTVANDSVHSLFPTSSFSYAFAFDPGMGYVQSQVLVNGNGYWGKFPAAVSVTLTGGLRTVDSIHVVTGWNIVGTISSPVDTSTILSVPPGLRGSAWYGYGASGYTPVSRLVPGRAYWVKSHGAGIFILVAPARADTHGSTPPVDGTQR